MMINCPNTVRPSASRSLGRPLSVRSQSRKINVVSASAHKRVEDGMLGKIAKSAAVVALVSSLTASASYAELDTDTYKAGPGAKIEYSDITDESPTDVVKKLKNEVVPKAQEKLNEAAERAGSQYPSSIAKELKTVKGEVDALDSKVESGEQEGSVVKSAASAVEQQVNALKALLGFD